MCKIVVNKGVLDILFAEHAREDSLVVVDGAKEGFKSVNANEFKKSGHSDEPEELDHICIRAAWAKHVLKGKDSYDINKKTSHKNVPLGYKVMVSNRFVGFWVFVFCQEIQQNIQKEAHFNQNVEVPHSII